MRFLFEIARAVQPCVVFIDEIDSLCRRGGGDGAGPQLWDASWLDSVLACRPGRGWLVVSQLPSLPSPSAPACSERGSQNEHEASRRMKTELLTQARRQRCHAATPPCSGASG